MLETAFLKDGNLGLGPGCPLVATAAVACECHTLFHTSTEAVTTCLCDESPPLLNDRCKALANSVIEMFFCYVYFLCLSAAIELTAVYIFGLVPNSTDPVQ